MRHLLISGLLAALAGCAAPGTPESGTTPADDPRATDLGLHWVKHAAEYRAITRQVYRFATRDLPGFLADKSFSALPGQTDAAALPPAVILDVDETVVSNVDFQLTFDPPFENHKLDAFSRGTRSVPVEGAAAFVAAARELGVAVFFVTNRPCEAVPGDADPCPQRRTTIDDLAEAGITTDADHVLLSEERGWTREKETRRQFVASTHRVLMLIGDDYGDFASCVRRSVVAPCTVAASAASRRAQLDEFDRYWGHGWYILPNPMHGSWTSIQ